MFVRSVIASLAAHLALAMLVGAFAAAQRSLPPDPEPGIMMDIESTVDIEFIELTGAALDEDVVVPGRDDRASTPSVQPIAPDSTARDARAGVVRSARAVTDDEGVGDDGDGESDRAGEGDRSAGDDGRDGGGPGFSLSMRRSRAAGNPITAVDLTPRMEPSYAPEASPSETGWPLVVPPGPTLSGARRTGAPRTERDSSLEGVLLCPECEVRAAARAIEDWSRDPYAYAREGRGLIREVQTAPGSGESGGGMVLIPLLGGKFGGGAPASDRAPRRLVAAPPDDAVSGSVVHTARYLRQIWSRRDWSPQTRRRILFDLWDECAESGPAEVVATGDKVRAVIIAFIARELPRGSVDGFGDAEVRALDRQRQSSRPFAPHSDSDDGPR